MTSPDKSDFDFSDQSAVDPMIKEPGNRHGVESMKDREDADDEAQRADLERKAARGATEFNFQTGRMEPVADHVGEELSDEVMEDEQVRASKMTPASGVADGPKAPHVGASRQSMVDDPKAATDAPKDQHVHAVELAPVEVETEASKPSKRRKD